MEKLVHTLQTLPPAGRRLDGGLALRLTRGNGMAVLGCSRVGVGPSQQEMDTVAQAVIEAFRPSLLFQADEPEGRGEHVIWRLYWPLEETSLIWRRPVQQQLSFAR